jgi:predicted nucleotide-binding protein (sugar kinase/HSP70/actin superfamily)
MPIQQIAYFNYLIDDIDKRQAVGGVMEALNQETSEGLANVMDKYLARLSLQKNALRDSATVQTVTKDNILGIIDKALEKLYENDVKQNTKITMTIPPWFFTILKQAYIDLDTNNSEMMKNGRVGKYGSIIVKMSNNVAKEGANTLIQVKTDRAIAFVNPMTHVEPYRPEKRFSDAVKGFILYDAKIVRPKEMLNIFCVSA